MAEQLWYPVALHRLMTPTRVKDEVRAFGAALRVAHRQHEAKLRQKVSDAMVVRAVARKLGPALSFEGSTLSRWKAGKVKQPDSAKLRALAAVYGVSADLFIDILEANRRDPTMTEDQGVSMFLGGAAHDRIPDSGRDTRTASRDQGESFAADAPAPLTDDDAFGLSIVLLDIADQLSRTAQYFIGRQAAVVGRLSTARPERHRKGR